MEEFTSSGGLFGFLVKGFRVELGLKSWLFLQGSLLLVGKVEELFVHELRGELLQDGSRFLVLVIVGIVLELEVGVLGLSWGLWAVDGGLLRDLGKATEPMITEQRHELRLGLGNRTGTEVVAWECRRDELGLHEVLGRGRMLIDMLRLSGEQRLLWAKAKHAATSRAVISWIDWDPVFAGGWSGIDCGSLETRVIDLSGPSFLLGCVIA